MTAREVEDARLADVARARLAELDLELEHGERELAALTARRDELQRTMLRIGGAAQVLRELVGERG